jgi:hypothetical protein
MASLNIAIKIAAQDAASGPIGQIKNALTGLGDSARSGFAGLQTVLTTGLVSAAAIGGAALIGIGAAALSVQGDVRQATNALIVGTGASGAALEEMRQSVINLAGSTAGLGHDMESIGGTMAELNTRTGITGDQLETTTGQFLQFTRLAGGDGARNVQLVTRVMGDWGVENEHTGQTLDTLFGASQAFGVGVDRIASQVVQFGAPLRQMGFTLEESIALFGKWEKEGVNAELAVGSLRIAAGNFARDNIPLQEGLRDTMEAIKGAATESEALAIAMDVFGARAGPDMAAAIREGRFELDEAIEALQATEGGLQDAADRTIDFRDRFKLMMTQARLSLLPLGDSLAGIAEDFLPRLGEVAERVIPQIADFLETRVVPAIEAGVAAVNTFIDMIEAGASPIAAMEAALLQLFGADVANRFIEIVEAGQSFIDMATTALAPITDLIDEFVSWQDVLIALGIVIGSVILSALASIVVAAAPVILVAAALIAGVALLRNAWERDWGGIQGKTQAVTAFITNLIQTSLATITRLWDTHGAAIVTTAKTAWGFIQAAIETVTSIISSVLTAFQAAREGDWTAFGENLRAAWDTAWEAISTIFSAAAERILTAITDWITDIKARWGDTDWGELAREVVRAIVEGLINGAAAIADAARNAARAALDAAKGFLGISSRSKVFYEVVAGESVAGMVDRFRDARREIALAMGDMLQPGITAARSEARLVGARVGNEGVTSARPQVVIYGGLTLQGVTDGDSLLESLAELAL